MAQPRPTRSMEGQDLDSVEADGTGSEPRNISESRMSPGGGRGASAPGEVPLRNSDVCMEAVITAENLQPVHQLQHLNESSPNKQVGSTQYTDSTGRSTSSNFGHIVAKGVEQGVKQVKKWAKSDKPNKMKDLSHEVQQEIANTHGVDESSRGVSGRGVSGESPSTERPVGMVARGVPAEPVPLPNQQSGQSVAFPVEGVAFPQEISRPSMNAHDAGDEESVFSAFVGGTKFEKIIQSTSFCIKFTEI